MLLSSSFKYRELKPYLYSQVHFSPSNKRAGIYLQEKRVASNSCLLAAKAGGGAKICFTQTCGFFMDVVKEDALVDRAFFILQPLHELPPSSYRAGLVFLLV